jgi:hypothetical protein
METFLNLVYSQAVEKNIHHYEIYQVQLVKFVFDLNLFVLVIRCPKINISKNYKDLFEIRRLTAIVI